MSSLVVYFVCLNQYANCKYCISGDPPKAPQGKSYQGYIIKNKKELVAELLVRNNETYKDTRILFVTSV